MNNVVKRFIGWGYKLLDAGITGAATSALTIPIFQAGSAAGMNVLPVNIQDMALIAVGGAAARIFTDLAKNGLPKIKELETDTTITTKDP